MKITLVWIYNAAH